MKKHLKRLAAPKSWPIQRKGIKFIAKPLPGPHKLNESITLNVILKDILKFAQTTKEVKRILNQGKVLVDDIKIKEHRLPIGIMDIISIPSMKKYYKVLYSLNGKFTLQEIKEIDAKEKISKIIGKKILKGKKTQINLYNGKNILVSKDTYKVGDSLVLNKNKIIKHLKLEKGAKVYITIGKYKGLEGTIEDIKKFNGNSPDIITVKIKNKKIKTKKDFAFVIK